MVLNFEYFLYYSINYNIINFIVEILVKWKTNKHHFWMTLRVKFWNVKAKRKINIDLCSTIIPKYQY